MKISYNRLKEYLHFDATPEEVANYLISCGLEVENGEEYESIKGGLHGLVVGEVLSCQKHPNSDHLHLTIVDVGSEKSLEIVCGAPNVTTGQKVVVATVGTTLYDKTGAAFAIKKSKIRGAESEGMICAEDEIGVGISHNGIMILPNDTPVGTLAAHYFNITRDYIFEIGLTPNRSDAISHLGVARDLYAVLKRNQRQCLPIALPAVNIMPVAVKNKMSIILENSKDCPKYCGMTIENVQIKESPAWLQNYLKSIGIKPINNIVDITQYIMFDLGQPLHAFDADKIKGSAVIIKNFANETAFTTLDGAEIKLNSDDLMICDAEKGLCLAGVYGGLHSGITSDTKNIFLESAYFHPVSVRKTSKRHALKTDAAFRFERGCDIEIARYALEKAADMICELAESRQTSEIIEVYPHKIEKNNIALTYNEINRVAGKIIEKEIVMEIVQNLGMEIISSDDEHLMLLSPLFKHDVTRPIDVIEEILRIYGYDNIEILPQISYPFVGKNVDSARKRQQNLSRYLAHNGFFEIMNNSLTKKNYADNFSFINENETVAVLNPISNETNVMRQTLLFSGLENVAHNLNNKNNRLRLFEFGKIYYRNPATSKSDAVDVRFLEKEHLSLFISGKEHDDNWKNRGATMDFFFIKNLINNILTISAIPFDMIEETAFSSEPYLDALRYTINGQELVQFGQIHPRILKYFDIKKEVYYAEFELKTLYQQTDIRQIRFAPLAQYPEVERDLALIIDKQTSYKTLEKIAYKYGGKLLKKVSLFDVYEGAPLENEKKSYALRFILQHADKTLTDNDINSMMNKLIGAFEKEANAKLR